MAKAEKPTPRELLFGAWAADYDAGLAHASGFPFEGYARVLDAVAQYDDGGIKHDSGEIKPRQRVLDVGTGTGELAARVAALGGEVVGVDLSEEMLAQAGAKVPQAEFLRLDLLGAWEALKGRHFDRIVSAYVFHEFALETKIALLRRLAALQDPGGVIVVGDIAFGSALARDAARRQWGSVWDESEHYWAADEDALALEAAGFGVKYTRVSFCAGVLVLTSNS